MTYTTRYSEPKRACPFCGRHRTNISYNEHDEIFCVCGYCEARGPVATSIERAIELWDTREDEN